MTKKIIKGTGMKKIFSLIALGITAVLSGCASNQYAVTYNSDPEGAQLYCGGVAKGYTPVKLYYTLDEETKKRGYLNTVPCSVKWVSGATAQANRQFSLTQFPNGVINTVPRPNVNGYSQDAEFALKVKNMKANQQAAAAAQQSSNNTSYQNNNTVQCQKLGEFINVEIKTFQGMVCPVGWIKKY